MYKRYTCTCTEDKDKDVHCVLKLHVLTLNGTVLSNFFIYNIDTDLFIIRDLLLCMHDSYTLVLRYFKG